MGNKPRPAPKPTRKEYQILRQYLRMRDWHFDILKRNCILIFDFLVHWDSSRDDQYAKVYGLRGLHCDTNELVIASFFIRYNDLVYQSYCLQTVTEILLLIEKDYKYDDYNDKLDEWNEERYQKRLAARKAKEAAKNSEVDIQAVVKV